jgi:hypothetical protein
MLSDMKRPVHFLRTFLAPRRLITTRLPHLTTTQPLNPSLLHPPPAPTRLQMYPRPVLPRFAAHSSLHSLTNSPSPTVRSSASLANMMMDGPFVPIPATNKVWCRSSVFKKPRPEHLVNQLRQLIGGTLRGRAALPLVALGDIENGLIVSYLVAIRVTISSTDSTLLGLSFVDVGLFDK